MVTTDPDPVRYRFNVEDYYRLAEVGILAPEARVELLDGEIFEMLPIGPFHANSVRRFNNFFARLGEGRWLVDVQSPVRLSNQSEPQPDFALLRPLDEEYMQRHPTPEDVFLLVEVADSSVKYDSGRKLSAYARAGIREYWIVNLVKRTVDVYRKPLPGGSYGYFTCHQGDDIVSLEAFPDVTLPVSTLLQASPAHH